MYVNLQDKNSLAVIDPQKLVVTAVFPLTGCEEPSALAIDAARERLAHAFFSKWNKRDFEELVRLVVRFADQIGSG